MIIPFTDGFISLKLTLRAQTVKRKQSFTKFRHSRKSSLAQDVDVWPDEKAVPTRNFSVPIDPKHDELWSVNKEAVPVLPSGQIALHYSRARDWVQKCNLTQDDIRHLTPAFWELHLHNLVPRDSSAFTTLSIHYNLCMGTILALAHDRPDLEKILADLANFNVCGEFMLTELGHGLDARNLETTATQQADGSFDLHTPNREAAKTMPPTTPEAGIARVAVVFARLIVEGEDRGVKPFLVRINEADKMCPGIKSIALPLRPGATPLDHAITMFNHVRLEPSSLLGSLEKSESPRKDFFHQIQRVTVGGLSLTMANIPAIRHVCYIVAKYSTRRQVQGYQRKRVPILNFRTQHRPILVGLAQAAVFEQYSKWAVEQFMGLGTYEEKHGIVTAFKAVVTRDSQATYNELVDRCGWQGLFTHNCISEIMLAARGNSIAEGDILVLCIRLTCELLLGKYKLPEATMPDCLLARHEAGLFSELKAKMGGISLKSANDRYKQFNVHILPWCKTMIETIGQRMAYEAAMASKSVPVRLIRLFESNCVIAHDSSWYAENTSMTRRKMSEIDAHAVDQVLPMLNDLLDQTGCEEYVTAPILADDDWQEFERTLTSFGE